MVKSIGVAEAKRRFSELIDRVQRGERIVVARRGRPAVALVTPDPGHERSGERPLGLAAIAGALADWPGIEDVVKEIYAARRRARDRRAPRLD